MAIESTIGFYKVTMDNLAVLRTALPLQHLMVNGQDIDSCTLFPFLNERLEIKCHREFVMLDPRVIGQMLEHISGMANFCIPHFNRLHEGPLKSRFRELQRAFQNRRAEPVLHDPGTHGGLSRTLSSGSTAFSS